MMHKILILDDDASIRNLFSSALLNQRYEVVSFESANEAKETIYSNTCSAIIIDIILPDLNGIEFIKEIQEAGIDAPVIIITGSSELEHAREAVRLQVFDYMVKPFKTNQLVQVVKNAVLHYELEQKKKDIEDQKRRYQEELEQLVDKKVSELRVSEDKFRNLIEQSIVGVYMIQNERFQYVNKKFGQIFGCRTTDMIQKRNLTDLAAQEDKEIVREKLARIVNGSETTANFDFKAISESGKQIVVQVWAAKCIHENTPVIEGILIDVSEQHEAQIKEKCYELELLNEHKLAAIGQLAAGIAHNMNTPISIIQGNAELLRLKYPEDSEEVDKILRQTRKLSELISTILIKGWKEQDMSLISIDLNQLLRDELEFLLADLYYKHHITKDFRFADNLPLIEGVYSDFSQSIMAFVQNAVDAMYKAPERVLTIKTESLYSTIKITIRDTGCGIRDEIKQRIFEPFFSTKSTKQSPGIEDGFPRGTGLGLSTAHNILMKYNATISFESKQGEGTEFIILIPASTGQTETVN